MQELFKFETAIGREALPLFPELAPCRTVFRASNEHPFDDPFLVELVASRPVQRLKKIGFLGAIDHVCYGNGGQSHRRRHNRYDHSVGVAQLACLYAEIRGLTQPVIRVLAAAGLLHDIGHGPLSHTLEPVFKSAFGISHHDTGVKILYGHSPYGNEIESIMKRYGVDLDEVSKMIDGTHNGQHSFLFSSPINLDTIEGITRSRSFFARSYAFSPAREIVEEIARSSSLPTKTLDAFWALKSDVYNVFIHHPTGLIYDGLAQSYMTSEIARFGPTDFLRTENQLRNREPFLFHIFAWAQKSLRRMRYRVAPSLFDYEVKAPQRSFTIDESADLHKTADLKRRYQQTKRFKKITVNELVNARMEAA